MRYAIALIACLVLPLSTARAEIACAPVIALTAKLAESGKVFEVKGNINALAYAETFGELPSDVMDTVSGVLIYDNGGTHISAGLIEGLAAPCVRFSIIIGRDKHLAAMDAVRGI